MSQVNYIECIETVYDACIDFVKKSRNSFDKKVMKCLELMAPKCGNSDYIQKLADGEINHETCSEYIDSYEIVQGRYGDYQKLEEFNDAADEYINNLKALCGMRRLNLNND